MVKYRYYVDQKETVWRRYHCDVEANSEEEAIEKMKADAFDYHGFGGVNGQIDAAEVLEETSEDMTFEENGNQPTREVYYKDKVCIEDNTPLEVRRDKKINTILNGKN